MKDKTFEMCVILVVDVELIYFSLFPVMNVLEISELQVCVCVCVCMRALLIDTCFVKLRIHYVVLNEYKQLMSRNFPPLVSR
jgi:hypothetical protein